MAAFTLEKRLTIKAVRLISLVAAATEFVFAKENTASCLVLPLVTVAAGKYLMLVFEHPAGLFVIECIFAPTNGPPAHDVEAAPLVFQVAVLAAFAFDFRRRMITLARSDPFAQVIMIVAA